MEENRVSDVRYVTLEGGNDEIENYEATIAMEKHRLERAQLVRKLFDDGTFHKLFSLESRRVEIAFATSHMINPMMKNKMQDTLNFHAWLEPYFLQLAGEVEMAEATIAELETAIEVKMGE